VTPDEVTSRLNALLRKSLSTIRELNRRVDEHPDGNCAEPIAIIGMACELPGGADSPEAFWTLLESGTTCERDWPTDEWRQKVFGEYFAGRPAAAHFAAANYLDRDITQFDPRAFNIAPTEACDMDPTQRLALELTAQALERAGYNPWQVPGTVGVYFGVIGGEYGMLARQSSQPGQYVATGSLGSVVSGRINHTFDFTGPSVSIDTACSSSLAALHLACEAIRHGDCDTAVVGGVNLLQDPSAVTTLAAFGALSPDGRCRPFTGDGTGYGRGEGAAVVVLKSLDTARRAGDQILATVRATAVNHDGRCSGLTVPNGKAQQQLLAGAVRKSGLRGADLDYLETHGTGTALGDPIELAAVGAVYGQDRAADRPLIVASNKAQIGHLEAASGIASLLKAVLVLQHGRVPAQAGADTLSPHIDFAGLMLRVPRTDFELPKRPAIAAVSAFGFSGTNAHVILASGEDTAIGTDPAHADPQRRRYALVLSARSAAALAQTVDRCIDHLQAAPQLAVADVCFSYAVGRAHGRYRTHVTGADCGALLRALRMHASTPRHVSRSRLTRSGAVQVSFFPAGFVPTQPDPRSPQWYRRFAGYRRGFDAIARGWTVHTGTTLPRGGTRTAAPDELACHQLAVLCGLIELLRSLGIEPQLWCPHGIGVYAVALQTGARGVDGVITELAELFAHNPPLPIRTPGGFDVLPVPAGGRATSDELAPTRFEAAVICQSSVDFVDSRQLHELDYWGREAASLADPRRVAARCVEHGASVAVLFGQGVSAVDLVDTLQVVQLDNPGGLDAAGDAADEVLALLLRLYELGVDVNWAEWYADSVVRRVRLPTSVFERASYVFEWTRRAGGGAPSGDSLEPRAHPSPRGSSDFDFVLSSAEFPLADTDGMVHIGYFVEMVMRALARKWPSERFAIAQMTFAMPLVVSDQPAQLRLTFDDIECDMPSFAMHSLVDADTNRWQQHVFGTLRRPGEQRRMPIDAIDTVTPNGRPVETRSGEEFYAELHRRGMRLGPSMRVVGEIRRHHESAQAVVDPAHAVAGGHAAGVAPGLLYACAQVFHAAMPDGVPDTAAFMVERLEDVVVHTGDPVPPHTILVDEVRLAPGAYGVAGRFAVFARDGSAILECRSCSIRWMIHNSIGAPPNGKAGDELQISAEETTALVAGASETVSSTVSLLHLETVVCRLVAELTGVPVGEISISDTTTGLGIDSIRATRLYRALEPLNPHDHVTLPRLIQGVTVGDLASALSPPPAGRPSEPMSGVEPDMPRRHRNSTAPPRSTSGRTNSYFQLQLADPQLRLLCVPYAGGSGLLYQGWQRGLPAGWEVCPVTLPGHGSRLDEPLVPDVYQVVDELTEEVLRLGEEPIAVYGHSAGALIGFLLAARLQAAGHPGPRRLYLAAFSSPNAEGNPFHKQCQARLDAVGYPDFPTAHEVRKMTPVQLQRLARAFGFPGLDRTDPQLLRTAMPILTNDIRMVASYRHDGATPLTAPISALHGHRDDRVTEQQVRDWAHWTTAPCRIHVLDGDHYFLHPDQCRDQVLEIIANGVAVPEQCP
jgi:acyl transferase domain-containing protein/surfactin synthase thioesterase subunit